MSDTRTKTDTQVAAIEDTQRAVEAAMSNVVEYLRTASEPTSEDAHAIIEKTLDSLDCESPEGHIVAGSLQSTEPHEKGSGPLKKGESIVIDIYPRSKKTDYFADMSRTVCLGAPSAPLQKMYDAVLAAQELAIEMIKPGAKCKNIQEAVENYFIAHGYTTSGKGKEFPYAEGFVHSVGHGVGLQIHEAPKVGRSDEVLQQGDVITIEPGLYYKDIGGVRIEDMLLVTKDGYRNLTHFNKQFVL
jgi:Xaa-Pro aminopeptidase